MIFNAVYPSKITFRSTKSPPEIITEAYNVTIPTVILRIETETPSQSPKRFSLNNPYVANNPSAPSTTK